jgi:polar amino acid transport system substrate-binding protein
VIAGRAYANLAGNTVVKFAATRNPQFVPDFVLKETRAHWAAPLRRDSTELRDQIDWAIECLKKDGTIAQLSEKWFGAKPGADDAENTPFPGRGVPDMPGYDPTPHARGC